MFVVAAQYGFAIASTKLLAIAETPNLGAGMEYRLYQTADDNCHFDGSGCLCSQAEIVDLGEHTLSRAEETAAVAAWEAANPEPSPAR